MANESTQKQNDVWSALNVQAPTPATKPQVMLNNRHNRTIRINTIKCVVRGFAKLNDAEQNNFGLVKAYLGGKRFYFGVISSGTQVELQSLKTFPTGLLGDFLELYWLDNNDNAVGVIVKKGKVLPIINAGDHLVVGTWR